MRTLIIASLVIVAIVVGGCSSSDEASPTVPTAEETEHSSTPEPFTPPPKSPVPEGFLRYTGSSGTFEIIYPEGWEIISEMGANFVAGLKREDGTLAAGVHVWSVPRPQGGKSLAAFMEAQSAYLAGRPFYFSHGIEKMLVFGKQAYVADYEMAAGASEIWRYLTMWMAAGDSIWTVTCSCPADAFGEHEGRFHRIIESFYLLGDEPPEVLEPSPVPSPLPVPPIPGG